MEWPWLDTRRFSCAYKEDGRRQTEMHQCERVLGSDSTLITSNVKKEKIHAILFRRSGICQKEVWRNHRRVRQRHTGQDALSILNATWWNGNPSIFLYLFCSDGTREKRLSCSISNWRLNFHTRFIYSQCERCQSPRRLNLTQIHRFTLAKRTLFTASCFGSWHSLIRLFCSPRSDWFAQ